MTGTRPDLCYIVTRLAQHMSKPTQANLNAAKYALGYLKGTSEQSLRFRKSESPLTLIGYSDSDWGGSLVTERAYQGIASNCLNVDHKYHGRVESSKQ